MEKIKKAAGFWLAVSLYAPMQLVAPRAVTIAVAILAIICTMNLMVSLFVIVGFNFKWLILIFVVTIPHTLCHLERSLLPVISSIPSSLSSRAFPPPCHLERSREISFLRPHVRNFTPTCGSFIFTMRRYHICIAVNE